MGNAVSKPPSTGRNLGIDLARGLAVVMMIETHALDGWVSAADKISLGYRFSRIFSNIPAPLFLLLAGLSLGLQTASAERAGKDFSLLRGGLAKRAMEVVGYGYLVSLIYAILDWRFALPTILRADILHCIGLSLLLCTYLLVGRSAVLARTLALVVAGIVTGLIQRYLPPLPLPVAAAVGLVVDVAPITRFPLFPLCGFAAVGFWIGKELRPTDWPIQRCLVVFLIAVGLVFPLQQLTSWTVAVMGGRLSRAHPAVVWNFLEGTARAVAVLAVSLALAAKLPARALGFLIRLGRGSLLAYAFHIPFCYGRVATPILGKLAIGPAALLLFGLVGLTWLVVAVRDGIETRNRPPSNRPGGLPAKSVAASVLLFSLWLLAKPTASFAAPETNHEQPRQEAVARQLASQGRFALAYALVPSEQHRAQVEASSDFDLRVQIETCHQLFTSGRFRESAEAYAQLWVNRPDLLQALFNIGQALRRAGEHEPALWFYRRFLQADPQTNLRAEVDGYIRELSALITAKDLAGRKPTPVYKKAWFWVTIASAVVVTTAVVIGVTLGTRSPTPPNPDEVLGPFQVVFPK